MLLAAAGLVALAVAAASLGRLVGTPPSVQDGTPAATIELFFEDRPDGAVAVRNAATGAEIMHVDPTTGGFMRAIMRSMVRERRAHGLGPETPFRLTRWDDGRLTIDDPATGRRVELVAFGPTNLAAFAQLLPPQAPPTGTPPR
jgi:putative photosynthetic complex assembly protein